MNKKINNYFFLAIITILAVARFINLLKIPIFHDEAVYLWISELQNHQPSNFMLPFKEGIAPLFIWIFGILNPMIKSQNQLLAGRVFMVFCDLISALFVFLIAKKIFSKNVALTSLLIYLIIPLNYFHSRFILLEPFSNMLLLISIYYVINLYFSNREDALKLKNYLTVSLLVVLSYLAKPVVVSGFIAIGFIPLLTFQMRKIDLKKMLRAYIKFMPIILIMILTALIINRTGHYYSTYLNNPKESLSQLISSLKQNLWRSIWWLINYLTLPLIITVTILTFYQLTKKNWTIVWLALWIGSVILTDSIFITHYYPRHLFLLAAPVSIILGNIINLSKNKFVNSLVLILILFSVLKLDLNIMLDPENAPIALEDKQQFFQDYTSGVGLPQISKDLKNISKNKNIILFAGDETLLTWALPKIYGVGNTQLVPIKNYLGGETDYYPSLTKDKDNYLLLNKYPYPPKNWNAKLISSYPKGPNRTINLYKINLE